MTYGVIICTKCREHAQIIEVGSSKTTRCQRCNASLNTRKLRVFFTSDELEETISVRTQIQAKLSGTGTLGKSLDALAEEYFRKHQTFGNEIDEKAACLIDNRKIPKKKKADELIIGILVENNNQMNLNDLKEKALKMDVSEEQFNDIIKKLLMAGELYSPSKDFVRIV
jgi:DNA replicative helicase MCM subunit Mcm2 (Cdc46/Mcm family)